MQQTPNPAFQTIPYLRFFKRGLYWNLFDSISSQGLVILFHLLVRKLFGTQLHGTMGLLLSVFYIMLVLSNAGLDQSMAPFLEYFTKSRSSFRRFFYTVFLPQLPVVALNGLLLLIAYRNLSAGSSLSITLSPAFYTLIAVAFLLESMRKTLRTFLQLIFYNKLTAVVEMGNMVLYCSFVLLCYYGGVQLSLERLWGAFTALIGLQVMVLGVGVVYFYRTLPTTHEKSSSFALVKRMLPTRLFTWTNQSMGQLFSGNLLVPLSVAVFGIEHASLMKVMSTISQWISLISNKTFGISSNALLAHLKTRSLATQQNAFLYLSSLLSQALYFLGIFLLLNGKKIVLFYVDPALTVSWSLLYFMLINNFLESLFVLYEKWYIFEEEAFYLLLFNAASFSALYLLLTTISSPFSLALSVLAVRALTLLSITIFSSYRWNIWPSYKPYIPTLVVSVAISSLFFFFVEL